MLQFATSALSFLDRIFLKNRHSPLCYFFPFWKSKYGYPRKVAFWHQLFMKPRNFWLLTCFSLTQRPYIIFGQDKQYNHKQSLALIFYLYKTKYCHENRGLLRKYFIFGIRHQLFMKPRNFWLPTCFSLTHRPYIIFGQDFLEKSTFSALLLFPFLEKSKYGYPRKVAFQHQLFIKPRNFWLLTCFSLPHFSFHEGQKTYL